MKIYTKTGDAGTTALFGGQRVPKHHIRIVAYGTVDELNSFIGLIRDQPIDQNTINDLLFIQDRLFTLGSHLAAQPGKRNLSLPQFEESDITFLEQKIDEMDKNLLPMKNFILPGGNSVVSYTHIARCVCRRAERHVVLLSETDEVSPLIMKFLNRLSDYLFTLSRKFSNDFKANEIPWIPKG